MSEPVQRYLPTSWYDPRVQIHQSTIAGGGLFAAQPFRAGEVVAVVGGTLMTMAELAAIVQG